MATSARQLRVRSGPVARSPAHDRRLPSGRGRCFRTLDGALIERIHRHHETDEIWYILAGQLTFSIGSEELQAERGTCVVVPRRVLDGLANSSPHPVRYLLMLTP